MSFSLTVLYEVYTPLYVSMAAGSGLAAQIELAAQNVKVDIPTPYILS
jgi:hypothetical protein